MCIRDRNSAGRTGAHGRNGTGQRHPTESLLGCCAGHLEACLLYTSDAADERSSVDLGGRRIIKKKKDTQI